MKPHPTALFNVAAVLSITLGCSDEPGDTGAEADPLGQGAMSASASGAGASPADTSQAGSGQTTGGTTSPTAVRPAGTEGTPPGGGGAPTHGGGAATGGVGAAGGPGAPSEAGSNTSGATVAGGAPTPEEMGGMTGDAGGASGNGDPGAGGVSGNGGVGGLGGSGLGGSGLGGSGLGGSGLGGSGLGGSSGVGGDSGDLGSGTDGETPITVWLAGDSTLRNNAPCVGWGDAFEAYFNNNVTVMNSALAGRGIRQWLYYTTDTLSGDECAVDVDGSGQPLVQDRWQNMLDNMGLGDYLLIQFGINDGAGCPRYTSEAQYPLVLGMMAEAAKARGAHPIFLTAVSGIGCSGSTATGTRGSAEPGSRGYVDETFQAGVDYDVPVIDLHQLSIDLYNELGFCPVPGGDVSASTTGAVGEFFCEDHTHFGATGASGIAELVAQAVVDQGIGLGAYHL